MGELAGAIAGVFQSSASTDNCIFVPISPPELRLGDKLWLDGDEKAWKGLAAVALARFAWGTPLVRALSPTELDLLLAASFESVDVFNAITADPDPSRLSELSGRLTKLFSRRQRQQLSERCKGLSKTNFEPGLTARSLLLSDLRLAAVLSGDLPACLSAACQLDGVPGPGSSPASTRAALLRLCSPSFSRTTSFSCEKSLPVKARASPPKPI